SSASRSDLAVWIQRSIVSAITKRGRSICSSTCACRDGAILASKTKSVCRYVSGNSGLKSLNTFRSMERVSRVFRSHEYSPDQRKVFPFTCWTPSVSIFRDFQKLNSDFGKSLPTMPTSRTGQKKLAASAPYEPDTPNNSECSSTGVLTVSIAMEPTTRTDIGKNFKSLNRLQRYNLRSRQHICGATRIINDAVRVEQCGNQHNPFRAGVNHAL